MAILSGHPYDQLPDLRQHWWASRTATCVTVVLVGDQSSMPREQCIRCNEGTELSKGLPAECLGLGRQADALVVGEPQPPRPKLLSKAPDSPPVDSR